jgi:mycothiol synthase
MGKEMQHPPNNAIEPTAASVPLSQREWDVAGLSQLRMGYFRLPEIPSARVVAGYSFRTFRAGDEAAWISILNTGDFGAWDRHRLDQMLAGARAPLPLDSIVFATEADDDGVPVGVANAFLYDSGDGQCAELGWLAVRPEHRGHGLAYEICRRVLGFSRASGHRYVFLKTEDFRVAAIKTYLRLGFEPEMKPDQVERWAELRRLTAAA